MSLNVFPFFWRPKNVISSLKDLPPSENVPIKKDVSILVAGQKLETNPLHVAELPGGKIIGDVRLVATADDVTIGGLQALFACETPQNHYLVNRRRLRLPKFRCGTALLLATDGSENYYHWLLDSLPRWKILQAAHYSDYDFVLLHGKPANFQDETLDLLGVPVAKRLRCSKNFVHQFERLVVPAMPFQRTEIPTWACAWLRSLFPQKNSGPEKIYLTRGAASRRRLINEPELQTALDARGFISFQPEKLSVAEQAKFLSAAKCVVAPHGAALTNLIFAPSGALLLELFHPQHKNKCYLNLAEACGHRYAFLDGQIVNSANTRELKYSVDVSAVLKILDANA